MVSSDEAKASGEFSTRFLASLVASESVEAGRFGHDAQPRPAEAGARAAYLGQVLRQQAESFPELHAARLASMGVGDIEEAIAAVGRGGVVSSSRYGFVRRILGAQALSRKMAVAKTTERVEETHWLDQIATIVRPLIQYCVDEGTMQVRLAARPGSRDMALATYMVATSHVPLRLTRLLSGPFVSEMHFLQERGILAKGGDAFDAAIAYWVTEERPWEFLARYPTMARLLTERLTMWATTSARLAVQLSESADSLRNWLGIDALDVVAVQNGLGDEHDGGQSVTRIFTTDMSFIYKPRPCGVFGALSRFMARLNDLGSGCPQVYAPEVLDCGTHGWLKWLDPGACQSDSDIGDYYNRMGQLLAVLWILGGTDFHSENIFASGSHPVLLDAETLLAPRRRFPMSEILVESPLATGILPYTSTSLDTSAGVDLSAFGNYPGQEDDQEVSTWSSPGTGYMRHVVDKIRRGWPNSFPRVAGGERIDQTRYERQLIHGFMSGIDFFRRHHRRLLSKESPLEEFRSCTLRVVLRPTADYGRLLSDGLHPDLLVDALVREQHFDSLRECTTQDLATAPDIVDEEMARLRAGEVPLFTATADSTTLRLSGGPESPNFYLRSAIDVAYSHVASLSSHRRVSLEAIVRASLTTRRLNRVKVPESNYRGERPPSHLGRIGPLLSSARRLGHRLIELAVPAPSTGYLQWCDISGTTGKWLIRGSDSFLYRGTAGQLLLFEMLSRIYPDPEFHATRDALLRQWTEQVEDHTLCSAGAFDGLGGQFYVTAILGSTGTTGLDSLLRRQLTEIEQRYSADRTYDVIAGSAGALLAITGTYSSLPTGLQPRAYEVCEALANHLVENAKPVGSGCGWNSIADISPVGFAHGSAGIGLALRRFLRIAPVGNSYNAIVTAIGGAAAWERDNFDVANANWIDLRSTIPELSDPSTSPFSYSWCNGAAGIGLARAGTLTLPGLSPIEADQASKDLAIALAGGWNYGLRTGQTLCHGDLGVAELFLAAYRATGKANHLARARRIGLMVARWTREHDARVNTGVDGLEDNTGMMTGATGVAYGLLRIAFPALVPAILSLEA